MRLHRFYVSQPLGEEVVIEDVSLINQWTKVFRYTLGDSVVLFNGDSVNYHYSFSHIQKKSCTLACISTSKALRPSHTTSLYLSLIKKDNFELVTQKATELGVIKVVPVLSVRSSIKNLSEERLKKIAIESSEQCGRSDIPEICPAITLSKALEELPEKTIPIALDFSEKPLTTIIVKCKHIPVALFIGPEGGWSAEDVQLFEKHKVKRASLGETTLRAETAAICASFLASQRNL